MNYWLVKSEPFKYPWEQLVKDKKAVWDGVRNYEARNNLRAMKKGDLVFFYHSNEGVEIVGIAKVAKESYQDPTTNDTNWVVVELAPVKRLKKTVPLTLLKSDKQLSNMAVVKRSRLSVTPVTTDEFHRVLDLSETSL